MIDLTFTQEQRIKRLVSRFKFDREDIGRAVAMEDAERAFFGNEIQCRLKLGVMAEKVLGRGCACSECKGEEIEVYGDPEFDFCWRTVEAHLFSKFESLVMEKVDAGVDKRHAELRDEAEQHPAAEALAAAVDADRQEVCEMEREAL